PDEDGAWRYADGNGQMVTNRLITIENKKYYFDAEGRLTVNQWFSVDSTVTEPSKKVSTTWYYAGADGAVYQDGWFSIDGAEFYFTSGGGVTRSGIITIKEDTGAVDENGEAVTISRKYYIDETYGRHEEGWFPTYRENADGSVTTTWYYANPDGELCCNGFFDLGGNVYYFDTNGANYRYRWYADPETKDRYYFNEEGVLQKDGWYPIYTTNTTTGVTTENWYYGDEKGSVSKGGFIQMGDDTYYFDVNGRNYRKQWYVDPDTKERYYLDEEGHLQTGWFDIVTVNITTGAESVATYYANADGSILKGDCYLEVEGRTYYFTANGAISKKRWMVDAGKGRKYLNEDGMLMEKEWFSISGTASNGADYTYWYYATDEGRVLRAGWHTVEGKEYYFNASGVMQTGWVDGNRYYCGDDGARLYGWQYLPLKDSWMVSTETELMEYVGYYGDTAWFYFSPLTGRVYYSEEDTYKEIRVDGETYCVDERGIIQQGWIRMRSKSPTVRSYKYYMEAETRSGNPAVTIVAGERMILADVQATQATQEETASTSNASALSDADPTGGATSVEWRVGQMVHGGWFYTIGPDEDSSGNEEWFYFKDSGYPETASKNGTEEILTLDGKRYLINSQGNALTGLREINEEIYYFNEDTLALTTGKCLIDDGDSPNSSSLSTYYFDSSGVGYTGNHGGVYYYMGKMQAADKTSKYQAFDLPDIGVRLLDSNGRIVKNRTVKDGGDNKWVTAADGEIKEYGNQSVADVVRPSAETGDY
ncbi:MAG: hypothetical protein LUE86_13080, partial [Clostridiales bacterium]|nr:hypothetical protein [Clostridiales bacterium]